MSAKDAAIVARWKGLLKTREGLLAYARRQEAYWSKQYHKAKPDTARRTLAYRTLKDRKAKVAHREAQVSDARAVIASHSKPSLRERAYAESLKDLGVTEKGGNNRGPEVEKIIREAGGTPGESWCGDGVFVWYKRAGSKSTVRAWAAVRFLEQLLTRVKNPAQGHVVIYQWDGGPPDHTGLFERWTDKSAGKFTAIEANTGSSGATSDSLSGDGVRRRERNTSQVSSFRRVLR